MTSRDTRAATHEARLYVHFLDDGEGGPEREGGADRGLTLAERIQRRVPNVGLIARNQRLFVLRAVRAVAEHYGIRRFLDIGSRPDHAPNVHEVAQASPHSGYLLVCARIAVATQRGRMARVAEVPAGQRGLVHTAGGGIGQRGVLLDIRGTGPGRDPIRARVRERGLRDCPRRRAPVPPPPSRRDQPSSPGGVPQLWPPGPSNPTELMKSR